MLTKITKLPKSQVEIELIIEQIKIAAAYEKQYQKLALTVKIKGFRPGAAPRNLIENSLGREKILEETLNDLIFEAYREAVKEHQLTPISYPEFKVSTPDKNIPPTAKDLKVKAVISVRPQAKLNNYQKIRAKKKETTKVTEKEVKDLIQTSFESWKKQEEQRNPARGWSAVGRKETKKSFDKTQDRQKNKVETATTLSEARQKASGEQPTTNDQIDISKLGQELTFTDFLKANQVSTKEELEKKVEQSLNEQRTLKRDQDFVNEILEKLLKMTEIELPEVLINQELNEMERSLEAQFKPLGISVDEYLKHKKTSREELKEKWRPQAEKNVRIEFALSAVADQEKIFISDDEVTKVIAQVADEKIRRELERKEQKVYIKYSLQREKTINRLKEIAAQ